MRRRADDNNLNAETRWRFDDLQQLPAFRAADLPADEHPIAHSER